MCAAWHKRGRYVKFGFQGLNRDLLSAISARLYEFPKPGQARFQQLSLGHLWLLFFLHDGQLHGPAGHQLPEGIFLHPGGSGRFRLVQHRLLPFDRVSSPAFTRA
jgi:hypothetical protein